MAKTFSLRLREEVTKRLGARARRVGAAPRTLAQRYIDEGIRQDEHPLIRFVDGPAGRRPALIGTGLDVWEVIATVRDNSGDAEEAAAYLEIPRSLVDAAVTYYGGYRAETDEWIELNEREAEEARSAWLAGRRAIGREAPA